MLSVRQPFASALFGPKPGENREWRPTWEQLRPGDWLAIHASVSLYVGARKMVNRWRWSDVVTFSARDDWGIWTGAPTLDSMPRNAIIGLLRYNGTMNSRNAWRQGDAWANEVDCHYWQFSERRPFEVPIVPPPAPPMAHAGLWLAPPDVVAIAESMGCVNG